MSTEIGMKWERVGVKNDIYIFNVPGMHTFSNAYFYLKKLQVTFNKIDFL
jgi:hypothetical protein